MSKSNFLDPGLSVSEFFREIIDSFELLRGKKKQKPKPNNKKKIKKPFLIKI